MVNSELIKTLSQLNGVSGHEEKITKDIKDIFEKYCHNVTNDNLGNIIGLKKSKNPDAKRVMLEAHMDEIGMMVTDIDKNGFLYFTSVGGIDPRILLANEVLVHGKKEIFGIIGAKPPHVITNDEKGNTIPFDKLYIDTGYSKQEIEDIVSIGDVVTFSSEFRELKNDVISTKSQDDRTSVAILIDIMQRLSNTELPFDLYFVAAVQEEVGLRGARTGAYSINPDFAIIIDVCHASTPDASKDVYDFGSGAIVSKGPNIHPVLVAKLIESLKENNIKYEIDVDGGNTGTDAWSVQITRCGIPVVLFSIPLRYMHTPIETVSLEDVNVTASSIATFLSNVKKVEDCIC